MLLFWLSVAACWRVFPRNMWVPVIADVLLLDCELFAFFMDVKFQFWLSCLCDWCWASFIVSVSCPGLLFSELPIHISCPFLFSFECLCEFFVDVLCILEYKSLSVVMLCDYFLPFLGSSALWTFSPLWLCWNFQYNLVVNLSPT